MHIYATAHTESEIENARYGRARQGKEKHEVITTARDMETR